MAIETDLLLREYQEVNGHLRANTAQFVNWFSFFLMVSLVAAGLFLLAATQGAWLRGFALVYGVPLTFLLLHVLAFVGIFTFRRYIMAAHCKVEEIVQQLGEAGKSPVPLRFCQWMTDLMAAGFVISYFVWLSMLFVA